MHNNDNDPRDRREDQHDNDETALDAKPDAKLDETLIEESLHDALSDLEQILERRGSSAQGHRERVAETDGIDTDTEQYVIPLLDEVVIPGAEGRAQSSLASDKENIDDDDDEPALRRRLAERLASEIEIITQDRIEAALEAARKEIRVKIRNHLDIILPEIVEELNQWRPHPTTIKPNHD